MACATCTAFQTILKWIAHWNQWIRHSYYNTYKFCFCYIWFACVVIVSIDIGVFVIVAIRFELEGAFIHNDIQFPQSNGSGECVVIFVVAHFSVILVCFGCCCCLRYLPFLNWMRVVFVWFRYLQAALAPMALDIVRKQNLSDLYGLANTVLIVSVLAIILTAPLGAILMVIEILYCAINIQYTVYHQHYCLSSQIFFTPLMNQLHISTFLSPAHTNTHTHIHRWNWLQYSYGEPKLQRNRIRHFSTIRCAFFSPHL